MCLITNFLHSTDGNSNCVVVILKEYNVDNPITSTSIQLSLNAMPRLTRMPSRRLTTIATKSYSSYTIPQITYTAGITPCMGSAKERRRILRNAPDSKVHGANMGPIWGRQDPGGPHVGTMNFAIWGFLSLTEFISRIVTPLLIGWAHTQNDLCIVINMFATIGRQSLKWGHRSMRMLGKVSCRWTIYFLIHSSNPPEQNGRHFADDIFKCIFKNKNLCILIQISLKFVPMGPIDNNAAFVQLMAWRRTGDKPLSETMLTHFTDAYMRMS